mgnify:CR=1 FL=1|tara:strand:- start:256 stop:465 length:210 start_codon:yes stop_codon:yes gene_type:complete
MRLSDQALGAVMMALQNSLMHQTDIVPMLKGFDLALNEKEEIIVLNPPVIESPSTDIGFKETTKTVGSD